MALTRDLIRFRTINPPGEEEACARHLGRLLQAAVSKSEWDMELKLPGVEPETVELAEPRTLN